MGFHRAADLELMLSDYLPELVGWQSGLARGNQLGDLVVQAGDMLRECRLQVGNVGEGNPLCLGGCSLGAQGQQLLCYLCCSLRI